MVLAIELSNMSLTIISRASGSTLNNNIKSKITIISRAIVDQPEQYEPEAEDNEGGFIKVNN